MRVEVGTVGSRNARIWLNGKPMRGCVMADDELGCVEFHERDENGKLRHKDGILITKREFGDVKITFADPA